MPFDFAPLNSTAKRPCRDQKRARGSIAFHAGRAAEDQVAKLYAALGYTLLHTRWRGAAGEIDLVLQDARDVVFVEVKSSVTHDRAAQSLRPAQMKRLLQAAEEFIGTLPRGALTPMRIDAALVDGTGQIEIIENALMAF